jgi:enoyl-CoA hydratase
VKTLDYEVDGRVARITLNRPERGNGITLDMPRELAECVEQADLNPDVHVIALSGRGKGFCGGYDLVEFAQGGAPPNHDPNEVWDPVVDYQMMSRNLRGFMSLFHANKPVVCKVHGFCVAGGTDMALCSDLLVIADDARIGYPPARVWGVPTSMLWAHKIGDQRAKRLLFTGDLITGAQALDWGLAIEAPPADELDSTFEALVQRIAKVPVNQLVMMKLTLNQAAWSQGLAATQALGVVFDGVARHTPEGYAFQQRATEAGFKQAVRERDEPCGGRSRAPALAARLALHSEGSGAASYNASGGRRGFRFEDERLDCHIRLDVIGAHERNHLALGEHLDRCDQVFAHSRLNLVPEPDHRVGLAVLDQLALGLRKQVRHEHSDEVSRCNRPRLSGPSAGVLMGEAYDRARDRRID